MQEADILNMTTLTNNNEWLVYRGRYVETTFLIQSGVKEWLVNIHQGQITSVKTGPFVMPCWTFALRADTESWDKYIHTPLLPGFHDLMAMIKFKTLKLEGNQHQFMANLLYFKEVLANLRLMQEQLS